MGKEIINSDNLNFDMNTAYVFIETKDKDSKGRQIKFSDKLL